MDARRTKLACAAVALLVATAALCRRLAGQRRAPLVVDAGWRFQKGELPGAEKPDFDDFRLARARPAARLGDRGPVRPEDQPAPGGAAVLRCRVVPQALHGSGGERRALLFARADGAMSNATVFLNGHELGSRPYGYIGFAVDLTPHLNRGGTNVLAVRLAPEPESSRWYPGARDLPQRLARRTGPVHVAHWGTLRHDAGRERAGRRCWSAPISATARPAGAVTLETTIVDAAAARSLARRRNLRSRRARRPPPRRASSFRSPCAGTSSTPSLHRDQHRQARRSGARPLHDALRHPHDRVQARRRASC